MQPVLITLLRLRRSVGNRQDIKDGASSGGVVGFDSLSVCLLDELFERVGCIYSSWDQNLQCGDVSKQLDDVTPLPSSPNGVPIRSRYGGPPHSSAIVLAPFLQNDLVREMNTEVAALYTLLKTCQRIPITKAPFTSQTLHPSTIQKPPTIQDISPPPLPPGHSFHSLQVPNPHPGYSNPHQTPNHQRTRPWLEWLQLLGRRRFFQFT